MTKTYCDFCERELPKSTAAFAINLNQSPATEEEILRSKLFSQTESCAICKNKIISFIETLRPNQQTNA